MDSPLHLQARMALCRPEHMVLDLFVQSLRESIAQRMGRNLARAAGAPIASVPVRGAPSHRSAREYLELLHEGASTVEQTLGEDYSHAVEQLSFTAASHVFSAPVGAMVMAITGEDPHRGLSVGSGLAGATSTFGEREYERVSDTTARVRFKDEFFGPAWCSGLVRSGLLQTNPERRFRVELETGEPPFKDFSLLIHW
ncbi:DUF2378 family protein [Myxococcus sp. CA051A]|uniref:DUF2378 family protein n=1 Tax=Myxococcus llanfairpwllgwyngyllgogerychwyrndrobwllllantysiliogogogochensis TaxID=2590453 RepID=A0A540X618_9BACT|nr:MULTISPECIES: DUF2378 family protein [Myxococcus]NTX02867.1 DUF2378 family protein [Myxococcus sp. CA040A]NTX11287.1 DUF2378 family protein [Myxococcus sp. CA056]NTX34613.1 DUF2378 family protein [Myxococcus sp. CA033]NTX49876.1 DUF2378 family protein [Myxococcus sp. CA039A]NTX60559.1 DUF2378 family protein [Myxococcus sp. CA051A]